MVPPTTQQPERGVVPDAGIDIIFGDGVINQTTRPASTHHPNSIHTPARDDSDGHAGDNEPLPRFT